MGLKIILFVYFWLYRCITKLNLWNTFFWTNYLLLLNENLLNFTICRNTKLEGAISGPDRVGRFITGLALGRLPYRGHIFPDRGLIGAPPKFVHGSFQLSQNGINIFSLVKMERRCSVRTFYSLVCELSQSRSGPSKSSQSDLIWSVNNLDLKSRIENFVRFHWRGMEHSKILSEYNT